MCGIIGLISLNKPQDKSILNKLRDTMFHRGPDDAGEWWSSDSRVGLGHRRLSIIDLSSAGHQPMECSTGNLVIVFNGEIYNYKEIKKDLENLGHTFHTLSDTEVILSAYLEWGLDCLSHFNGMFAFAIFDKKENRIFLARDRAGEKPLYFYLTDKLFLFGSELKSLLKYPNIDKKINPEALNFYLSLGYIPGNLCIIENFKKLPPAHAMVYSLSNGDSKIWKYWTIPEFSESEFSELDLLDELETLLDDSCKKQLMADVPVGILLSGGVDSSLITAMSSRHSSKVKTFTIRFPGYDSYDETDHARLIANYFQTEHIELEAEENSLDLLPILAKQFDEPIIDSSIIPTYLVSKLIRTHCKVALGGDGGDELFGGYGHHSKLMQLKNNIGWLPKKYIRNSVSTLAEILLPIGFKGKNFLQGLNADYDNSLPKVTALFDRKSRRNLVNKNLYFNVEKIWENKIPKSIDILQRSTRMDFENYLPEDILVKVDRSSMLNSLEIRAPFLNYRLIEFAFKKVPSSLKANRMGEKKIILKKLCGKILPRQFDSNRKQGFSIPLSSWLQKDNWKEYMNDILISKSDSIFDKKFISNLLIGQSKGRSNSERIFGLVMFELWRMEYGINI